MEIDNFNNKINNFIIKYEKNKQNINILEFGVREGRSTRLFLELCKNNRGKLLSVDIDDYSDLFNDNNWKFIKCRDDDFSQIKPLIKDKLDLILIDSLHEPKHVSKLIYMYWENLSVNGSMYIDDISWLPYIKNNWRDHEYTENINRDTFNEILNIKNANWDNIKLCFDFNGSGMCRIEKVNNFNLNKKKLIINRQNFLKKKIKQFYNYLNHLSK